jgi:hypothetical protein
MSTRAGSHDSCTRARARARVHAGWSMRRSARTPRAPRRAALQPATLRCNPPHCVATRHIALQPATLRCNPPLAPCRAVLRHAALRYATVCTLMRRTASVGCVHARALSAESGGGLAQVREAVAGRLVRPARHRLAPREPATPAHSPARHVRPPARRARRCARLALALCVGAVPMRVSHTDGAGAEQARHAARRVRPRAARQAAALCACAAALLRRLRLRRCAAVWRCAVQLRVGLQRSTSARSRRGSRGGRASPRCGCARASAGLRARARVGWVWEGQIGGCVCA